MAKKNYAKMLYDLNQNVKLLYQRWWVDDTGLIMGVPVKVGDKIKDKYIHAYYKTPAVDIIPGIKGAMFDAKSIYDTYKGLKKPNDVELTSEGIRFLSQDGPSEIVGKRMSEGSKDLVNYRRNMILEDFEEFKDAICIEFDDETIGTLIGYNFVNMTLFDKDEYRMYLAISEFPLLKRFKHCKLLAKENDEEYFDVAFITFNNAGEKFIIKRRFVKISK